MSEHPVLTFPSAPTSSHMWRWAALAAAVVGAAILWRGPDNEDDPAASLLGVAEQLYDGGSSRDPDPELADRILDLCKRLRTRALRRGAPRPVLVHLEIARSIGEILKGRRRMAYTQRKLAQTLARSAEFVRQWPRADSGFW